MAGLWAYIHKSVQWNVTSLVRNTDQGKVIKIGVRSVEMHKGWRACKFWVLLLPLPVLLLRLGGVSPVFLGELRQYFHLFIYLLVGFLSRLSFRSSRHCTEHSLLLFLPNKHNPVRLAGLREGDWLQIAQWTCTAEGRLGPGSPWCWSNYAPGASEARLAPSVA